MNRLRAALVLAVVPLVLATGASHADPLLPGCWGAGSEIVCDVSASGVGIDSDSVPVCAGTCTNVPVPSLDTGSDICVTYTTQSGSPRSACAGALLIAVSNAACRQNPAACQ
jgi:hypothetical protein